MKPLRTAPDTRGTRRKTTISTDTWRLRRLFTDFAAPETGQVTARGPDRRPAPTGADARLRRRAAGLAGLVDDGEFAVVSPEPVRPEPDARP